MHHFARKLIPLAAGLAALAFFAGCRDTVEVGPDSFTSNCYWVWESDTYGSYQQQYCWSPYYRNYRAYYRGGRYVRIYPPGYPPHYRNPVVVVPPGHRPRPRPPVVVTPPPHPRPRPPVVVHPPRPRPRPRPYEALAQRAVTVSLPNEQLRELTLSGEAFAQAQVVKHETAPTNAVVIEALVTGSSESEIDALIEKLESGREHDPIAGILKLGASASAQVPEAGAFVESVDVLIPEGATVSIQ